MSIEKEQAELVVVGAGPGGYVAAFRAADAGLSVTLIDSEANPGGVCLYRGCIPSKALLHAAHVIHSAKEAAEFGLEFAPPKIDFQKLMGWKESVVSKLTGGLGQLSKQRKIRFIQGQASFVDAKTLRVTPTSGNTLFLEFKNCILATGSRPIIPEDWPYDHPQLLNSTTALKLTELPKKFMVIGGGYIGLELGSVMSALGSEVTVVEMGEGLLPGADRDLVNPLSKKLTKQFKQIALSSKVTSITPKKNQLEVKWADQTDTFDAVLVAIGRKPNSSGLGLSVTRIEPNEKGFIPVNAKRQTVEPNIYAIGDVAGEPGLAHKASHEARVAVENILGKESHFEPQAIPAVVYTDPEIAWCGLTETEAKKKEIPIEVAKFPWGASGRALTLGAADGLTKIILEPETHRILGMGISGASAGELIAEGVLAMEMGATAHDLGMTIHAHPTLSETVMEAAEVGLGQSPHIYKPKRK